ncbi:hypothetical protein CANCADRAFT_2287 [Tortispora caseinolytica NRRL Y-17796]|uniref:MoaB/Mog domain-containing protein n=1 Tax=Tortispora caseinolytica NRRL Y-17796 TaxID=767744 RepID=A0A1E4TFS4_9ASCO|nr:hypothetical protein CANCADRAFT_2287 [Tortispora caseinolytica NRRL Y-17796]
MSASHTIHTAACVIIGDEVLNGKIRDTNSNYFAKYCFGLGIDLVRIETVPDSESEIIEAVRRCAEKADFVVTSGGIGPTHDDITYPSIAKAYGLDVKLHQPTVDKMAQFAKIDHNDKQRHEAQMRMALLPYSEDKSKADCLFVDPSLWVPVAVVASKIHILPGIPQLFEKLLQGLVSVITPRLHPDGQQVRMLVLTSVAESAMAHFLTQLQEQVKESKIKIGSYPHWKIHKNTVSIIGPRSELSYLNKIAQDVADHLEGEIITQEQEEEISH